MFAAAMEDVASSLNTSAAIPQDDDYRRCFNPTANDRQAIRFLRLTMIGGGMLALFPPGFLPPNAQSGRDCRGDPERSGHPRDDGLARLGALARCGT